MNAKSETELFKEGDIVKIDGKEFECTFVTWRERDGKRENFTYSFRPKLIKSKEKK